MSKDSQEATSKEDEKKDIKQEVKETKADKKQEKDAGLMNEYAEIHSLTFGNGGGFTGGWDGATIEKNGKIFLIQKNGENEEKKELTSTTEKVLPLFLELQKIEFLKMNIDKPGNMTTNILVLLKDEKRHEIKFPTGNFPSIEVRNFTGQIEKLISDTMSNK